MSSSADRLKQALRTAIPPHNMAALRALADRTGVNPRRLSRALKGAPINVDDHLYLCAALGVDPVDGRSAPPRKIPSFDWNLLAIKVLLAIIAKGSMRALAKEWDIPLPTLNRVKHQQPVSVESLLAVCARLGCHPHLFLTRTRTFHAQQSAETQVRATA